MPRCRTPLRHPRRARKCACPDRAVAGGSWCPPVSVENSSRVSGIYESRHQLSLLADSPLAKGSEPVIATARVMWCVRIVRFRLTDEIVSHQTCQRPVKRARPKPNLPVRELGNEAHHGIPVAVARGQGQQDLEAGCGQSRDTACRTHSGRIQSVSDMTTLDISKAEYTSAFREEAAE